MAEAQERSHGSDSSPLKLPPFISNLFPFLKPKPPVTTTDANGGSKAVSGEKEPQNSVVSFPYNPPKSAAEPLKVEVEPSSGRTSNSVILWQVYALGGFLVLKWAWARWNERNERSDKKESTGDEDQPSQREDDDDQSSDEHED
ncbi:hypothetical protein CARUB_v10018204mg [Capsella rubella]|uniref:Uncharacterized protein n=1 Tax=Capsella rubella TaxID=81985 RepID=R0HLY3_9BRAS|nr:uncharacterized protein LOC17886027 [Capsella rubella]EOA24913.1 hypothetical protein CARUB_v10018204mg [Capsella rubella]